MNPKYKKKKHIEYAFLVISQEKMEQLPSIDKWKSYFSLLVSKVLY
jgi:hypothetical protein